MNPVKIIMSCLLLVGTAMFHACEPAISPQGCGESAIRSSRQFENAKSDEFEWSDAQIEGDCLTVSITRGGGCKEHEFRLIGAEEVRYSLPPQREIRIIVDTSNDMCKALLTSEVSFDISSLRIEGEPVLHLRLDGEILEYQ